MKLGKSGGGLNISAVDSKAPCWNWALVIVQRFLSARSSFPRRGGPFQPVPAKKKGGQKYPDSGVKEPNEGKNAPPPG